MDNLAVDIDYSEFDDYEEPEGIDLSQPQSDFLLSEEKYPLFLAGFGSGKSTCLGVSAINDLSFPGANVACYAPTYDLLSLIIIPIIEELLASANIPYKHQKNRNIISVEDYGNIIFRSLDNPARIVGYQVFRSHIDELDTIERKKAELAWNKIIARNRQNIYKTNEQGKRIVLGVYENGRPRFAKELNRISAYTTPEGFQFCYQRWEKNPKDGYKIYRASTYSNQHNLPDDYIDSLKDTYPAQLVDAYIYGYFVNLIGGSVYPEFDRDLNSSKEIVGEKEDLYVGMDFNVMRGAAVIHVLRNGLPHAVDEIYNAYDTDEQITYLTENYKNHYVKVYPDAAGTHRTSANTVETDIAKLEAAGFEVIYDMSNPAIKDRVFSLKAMICNGKGKRRYFVNTDMCPQYTSALEQQIWGDNGLPDKKAGLDHVTDGAGYYIFQEFPIIKPSTIITNARGAY